MKHLMYEHQTNLSETKADHLVALKLAQDDHASQENELIKDKVELKKEQKEQELSYMNQIRALKLVRRACESSLCEIYASTLFNNNENVAEFCVR